jgi:hypothetical protein
VRTARSPQNGISLQSKKGSNHSPQLRCSEIGGGRCVSDSLFNFSPRIGVLPEIFGKVVIPAFVANEELQNPKTPEPVRLWIGHPPSRVEVKQPVGVERMGLDQGEEEALTMGEHAIVETGSIRMPNVQIGFKAAMSSVTRDMHRLKEEVRGKNLKS